MSYDDNNSLWLPPDPRNYVGRKQWCDMIQYTRPLEADDSTIISETGTRFVVTNKRQRVRHTTSLSDASSSYTVQSRFKVSILDLAPVLVFSLATQLAVGIESCYDGLALLRLLNMELHDMVTNHTTNIQLHRISRGNTPLKVSRSIVVTYVLRDKWRKQFPSRRIPFLALSREERKTRTVCDKTYADARRGLEHAIDGVVIMEVGIRPGLDPPPLPKIDYSIPSWARDF